MAPKKTAEDAGVTNIIVDGTHGPPYCEYCGQKKVDSDHVLQLKKRDYDDIYVRLKFRPIEHICAEAPNSVPVATHHDRIRYMESLGLTPVQNKTGIWGAEFTLGQQGEYEIKRGVGTSRDQVRHCQASNTSDSAELARGVGHRSIETQRLHITEAEYRMRLSKVHQQEAALLGSDSTLFFEDHDPAHARPGRADEKGPVEVESEEEEEGEGEEAGSTPSKKKKLCRGGA